MMMMMMSFTSLFGHFAPPFALRPRRPPSWPNGSTEPGHKNVTIEDSSYMRQNSDRYWKHASVKEGLITNPSA